MAHGNHNNQAQNLNQFFGPGTSQALQASNEGGGFQLPNTLDPNQFPNTGGGGGNGPFFSSNVVPGVKSFIGPAYHGNPNYHFKQINFNKLNNLAIQSALMSQKAAQDAWEKRYPLLAQADKLGITSSLVNVSGKHDPFIYNALKQSGLEGADLGDNAYAQARNMGKKDLLSKDMRDRNYAASIFGNHPVTRLGLGPSDVWRIASANTGGLNASAGYAAQDANTLANAQTAANQQQSAAIMGSIAQLAGTGIRASSQSPYLNQGYYQSQYVGGAPDVGAGYGGVG